MNDLLSKINQLERQIQEKENELQLLKEDLEAIRAALETALEDQQTQLGSTEIETAITPPEPEEAVAPTEEVQEEAKEEPVSEEQQHEAIMRTIEEFSMTNVPKSKAVPVVQKGGTLGDRVGKSRLKDLKKAFGINERFLYANELFNGDMSAFTKALEELNHLESLGDAERLLDDNLAQKYKWDDESDAVISFRSTVSRRFV
ncbi:MAG: hypothetical protein RLP15_03285 [Cryomorphaceae bacterium]